MWKILSTPKILSVIIKWDYAATCLKKIKRTLTKVGWGC